jgi:hypothetical protein
MAEATITAWSGSGRPDEGALRSRMKAEGPFPYAWGNIPKDCYSPHVHAYDKFIYVVAGSIAFILPGTGEELQLHAGDRLDLQPGSNMKHSSAPRGFPAWKRTNLGQVSYRLYISTCSGSVGAISSTRR